MAGYGAGGSLYLVSVATDDAREPDSPPWVESSAQSGAGAASAVVGALLGPEVGPAVAAAANPVLTQVFTRVGRLFVQQSRQQGEAVLAEAAEVVGGVDELAELIAASPRRVQLAGQAVAAGSATTMEDKIRALGRCLAAGLDDDALVDPQLLIAAALADIEAPHVKVLRILAEQAPPAAHWTAEELAVARPELAAVVAPVLATLLRHGLIEVDGRLAEAMRRREQSAAFATQATLSGGGSGFPAAWPDLEPYYLVTPFGEQVLEQLRQSQPREVGGA